MPRVRLDLSAHEGRSEFHDRSTNELDIRIDTDVFDVLSGNAPERREGMSSTIERWLDCWSG
ncbi:hypothetical protein [Haloarcula marina]|uniref:hypothetical protein n=1 Tax=Haloarcula marina TaxID=2961574 RepID=UPI0020B78C9B|nr:hypothetical protein [Halomicroarcula marina]